MTLTPDGCLFYDGSDFCGEPPVARAIRCSRHYGVPSAIIKDPFLKALYDVWAKDFLMNRHRTFEEYRESLKEPVG